MNLSQDGIEVLALSSDTEAKAAFHRRRDGLSFELLSDPKLQVIEQYGLRHEKGLPFTTFSVLGIPLGWPVGVKPMAIPTTLLIDEQGVVRWIDQADDYRIRGDEKRIRDAIEGVWGDSK